MADRGQASPSDNRYLPPHAAMLISDLFREDLSDDVIRVGGAVELLHNASLIIDDI